MPRAKHLQDLSMSSKCALFEAESSLARPTFTSSITRTTFNLKKIFHFLCALVGGFIYFVTRQLWLLACKEANEKVEKVGKVEKSFIRCAA